LFEGGGTVETGELVPAAGLLARVGEVNGLAKIMQRLGMEGSESLGHAAAAGGVPPGGPFPMRRLSTAEVDGGGGGPDPASTRSRSRGGPMSGTVVPRPPGRTPPEAPQAPLRCPGSEDQPPTLQACVRPARPSEAPARGADKERD